jgi:hypothetical protein
MKANIRPIEQSLILPQPKILQHLKDRKIKMQAYRVSSFHLPYQRQHSDTSELFAHPGFINLRDSRRRIILILLKLQTFLKMSVKISREM